MSIFNKKNKEQPKSKEDSVATDSTTNQIDAVTSKTYESHKKIVPAMDIILITSAIAGLTLFMLAYMIPEIGVISALFGSVTFLPIGVALGILLLSSFRIKLLRKLTKKNLGFIKFLFDNRVLKAIVTDLDHDIVRFHEGIYIINKGKIFRETSEGIAGQKEIENVKVHFEEGIPVIYFDIEDTIPIDLKKENSYEKFRSPTHIAATLNKEIAVEKARVMKAFKSKENIFLIAILGLCLVIVYFSYSMYSNMESLQTALTEIKHLSTTVSQLIQQSQPANQVPPIIK